MEDEELSCWDVWVKLVSAENDCLEWFLESNDSQYATPEIRERAAYRWASMSLRREDFESHLLTTPRHIHPM